jgi:small-conductance mechanosensitive channel
MFNVKTSHLWIKLFLLTALLFFCGLSYSQNLSSAQPELKQQIPAYKVAPFGKTLFYIYKGFGAVSAQARANIIASNIKELAADPFFEQEKLIARKDADGASWLIVYLDKTILSINDAEAAVVGFSKDELARQNRDIIGAAIESKRVGNVWFIIVKRALLVLLIILATYFVLKILKKFYLLLRQLIWSKKDLLPQGFSKIITQSQQLRLLTIFLNIVRFSFMALILIIDAFLFLSLFPETRGIANQIIGYVLTPLKGIAIALLNYIPDLFAIAVIMSIFFITSKIMRLAAEKVADGTIKIKSFYPDWAMSTYNILRAILLIFTFIAIFPHLPNSNSDVFKGMSVFVGLLLSLGSTSIINNIVSGLVITYMRPFQIGDRIKMGENIGNVIEKTALVTRIKTVKNERITIPNSHIMTAYTINYTNSAREHGLILRRDVALSYDVPWRKVHEMLIEAALKTPGVLREPKPFVLQNALDDFYARYELNVYTDDADAMIGICSDLYANVCDVLIREKIDLNLPHLRKAAIVKE